MRTCYHAKHCVLPQLSAAGRITEEEIINVPSIYRFIDVDNAESASIVTENQ